MSDSDGTEGTSVLCSCSSSLTWSGRNGSKYYSLSLSLSLSLSPIAIGHHAQTQHSCTLVETQAWGQSVVQLHVDWSTTDMICTWALLFRQWLEWQPMAEVPQIYKSQPFATTYTIPYYTILYHTIPTLFFRFIIPTCFSSNNIFLPRICVCILCVLFWQTSLHTVSVRYIPTGFASDSMHTTTICSSTKSSPHLLLLPLAIVLTCSC